MTALKIKCKKHAKQQKECLSGQAQLRTTLQTEKSAHAQTKQFNKQEMTKIQEQLEKQTQLKMKASQDKRSSSQKWKR